MPYIKMSYREPMNIIVEYIGRLDILGDASNHYEEIESIVKLMDNSGVDVNGDLNYILYAVCKRYVKPSYNNYKKYLTKLNLLNEGDLPLLLNRFYCVYANNNVKKENFYGELDCCKREIYRRIIAPYEDKKIEENRDVY